MCCIHRALRPSPGLPRAPQASGAARQARLRAWVGFRESARGYVYRRMDLPPEKRPSALLQFSEPSMTPEEGPPHLGDVFSTLVP